VFCALLISVTRLAVHYAEVFSIQHIALQYLYYLCCDADNLWLILLLRQARNLVANRLYDSLQRRGRALFPRSLAIEPVVIILQPTGCSDQSHG